MGQKGRSRVRDTLATWAFLITLGGTCLCFWGAIVYALVRIL
jgi:hypothetical protein